MGPARTADSLYPPPLPTPPFDGNGLEVVGVAGNTLIDELRGDRGDLRVMDEMDAEEVDDAFE